MNIEHLKIFCRVIEEGNISKVARTEYISQPAVTKQIRQLEARYDTLLFERQDGRLIPTTAGKILSPLARNIVDTFEQSQKAVNEVIGYPEIVIHIGASFTVGDYLLPSMIKEFKEDFPDYLFRLTIENTPKIIEKLENGNIDIGLVENHVNNPSFIVETFAQDDLVLVVPACHRWKDREYIRVDELPEEKMIWRESESCTRLILENALQEVGILDCIQSSLELGSIQSIKSAVEAGFGISILPALAVEKELAYGILKTIALPDLVCTRDLSMVRTPQRFRKKIVRDFISFVQERSYIWNK